jgi:hypothetical protein
VALAPREALEYISLHIFSEHVLYCFDHYNVYIRYKSNFAILIVAQVLKLHKVRIIGPCVLLRYLKMVCIKVAYLMPYSNYLTRSF